MLRPTDIVEYHPRSSRIRPGEPHRRMLAQVAQVQPHLRLTVIRGPKYDEGYITVRKRRYGVGEEFTPKDPARWIHADPEVAATAVFSPLATLDRLIASTRQRAFP